MCRRSVAIRFRAVLSSTTWGDRRVSDLGGQKGQELCLSLGYDGSFPWCFMARKTHPKRDLNKTGAQEGSKWDF